MAKIVYPSSAVPAYKGIVSELRSRLNWFASRIDRAPAAAAEIGKQISAFLNAYSITPTLPSTQAIIANGQAPIPISNSAGVGVVGSHTADVANNSVTRIRLSSGIAPVRDTVKVIMPQVTGSYTNGYTFSVTAGVITGAVAS